MQKLTVRFLGVQLFRFNGPNVTAVLPRADDGKHGGGAPPHYAMLRIARSHVAEATGCRESLCSVKGQDEAVVWRRLGLNGQKSVLHLAGVAGPSIDPASLLSVVDVRAMASHLRFGATDDDVAAELAITQGELYTESTNTKGSWRLEKFGQDADQQGELPFAIEWQITRAGDTVLEIWEGNEKKSWVRFGGDDVEVLLVNSDLDDPCEMGTARECNKKEGCVDEDFKWIYRLLRTPEGERPSLSAYPLPRYVPSRSEVESVERRSPPDVAADVGAGIVSPTCLPGRF